MSDKLYDIPINFRIYASSEQQAEAEIMDVIKASIVHFGLEKFIVEYEPFEFLSGCQGQATAKSCCSGC